MCVCVLTIDSLSVWYRVTKLDNRLIKKEKRKKKTFSLSLQKIPKKKEMNICIFCIKANNKKL